MAGYSREAGAGPRADASEARLSIYHGSQASKTSGNWNRELNSSDALTFLVRPRRRMEGLPGERIDPCTGAIREVWEKQLVVGIGLELKLESGSPIRKVLIYRLGSLGDTVVALPCYHLIASLFPDAERRLLTNFPVNAKAPASAAVLGDSGLVHGYMRYTVGTRRIGELLRLVWEIRRFKPDLLIYLMDLRPGTNIRRDEIFFRIAGAKKIVGLPVGERSEAAIRSGDGIV